MIAMVNYSKWICTIRNGVSFARIRCAVSDNSGDCLHTAFKCLFNMHKHSGKKPHQNHVALGSVARVTFTLTHFVESERKKQNAKPKHSIQNHSRSFFVTSLNEHHLNVKTKRICKEIIKIRNTGMKRKQK